MRRRFDRRPIHPLYEVRHSDASADHSHNEFGIVHKFLQFACHKFFKT